MDKLTSRIGLHMAAKRHAERVVENARPREARGLLGDYWGTSCDGCGTERPRNDLVGWRCECEEPVFRAAYDEFRAER